VIIFFFMEETNYSRKPLLAIESETASQDTPASLSESLNPAADLEKKPAVHEGVKTDTGVGYVEQYSEKTFWQKMKLFQKNDFGKNPRLMGMVLRPLIFTTFPVVFFSGFMYGSIVCYFNVLNGTSSLILSAPPYNFSSSKVGLTYISCLIGVVVGYVSSSSEANCRRHFANWECRSYYSGPLGDRFVIWKARKNDGIMESEHRLWLYCALLVLIPGGLLLWGLGAAHHIHWFGLVVAMGVLAACIAIGCQLPVSYCIDSYKDLSGDAVVTVILIRNTMSFGVNYG
jgi:hypothetical protein